MFCSLVLGLFGTRFGFRFCFAVRVSRYDTPRWGRQCLLWPAMEHLMMQRAGYERMQREKRKRMAKPKRKTEGSRPPPACRGIDPPRTYVSGKDRLVEAKAAINEVPDIRES